MLVGRYFLKAHKKNVFTTPEGLLSGQFFLTQGFEQNLLLVNKQDFELLVGDFGNLSITDPLARLLSRLMLGRAVQVYIDNTLQLHIPDYLAELAQLTEKAILIGQGRYFELWSPVFWQEQESRLMDTASNSDRFHLYDINFA
jgi:MraZ protein